MSNDHEVGYYALITADVLYHPNLSPASKLFYGTLTSLAKRYGYCFASNKRFEEIWNVDERTIQRWLEELKEEGFIEVEIDKMGMVTKRKIYPIFQKSSPTRQNCQDRPDKNVPLDTAKVSGHHISIVATDNDIEKLKQKDSHFDPPGKEHIALAEAFYEMRLKIDPKKKRDKKELDDWSKSFCTYFPDFSDHEMLFKIMQWIPEDPFWRSTVFKPKGLNNNFDQLKTKAINPKVTYIQQVKDFFKHGEIYNGAECFIDDESIAFQRGHLHLPIKFNEHGFKDQFQNIIQKLGIKWI